MKKRPYRMTARAEAASAATERILDAAVELFWRDARPAPLADVAERAGVSVHSIIRRFGGQEGLIEAASRRESGRVAEQRNQAVPGDLAGSVAVLVEHYEAMGELVLRMLAGEETVPALEPILEGGRAMHADWCERVFANALAERTGRDRHRLHAQLVAICDVQTWNLLRRVRGLSRRQTELALIEMLEPLVGRSMP